MSQIELKVQMQIAKGKWAEATISVRQKLIMLHSHSTCSQWPLDGTGVELTNFGNGIAKLGFHHTGCASSTYQSFYFNADDHEAIEAFFKGWGFPMPRCAVPEKIAASKPTVLKVVK